MPKNISIWFFTGALLLIYGVLILATGVWALSHPPEHPVVLASLHIDIWWGVLLTLIGLLYCWKFAPGKE
ncbi:MAG: hypothetical protein IPP47_29900 [Bryobacterales bacterium]|nr:hypothetical protein [Bryobacterales bacterium]